MPSAIVAGTFRYRSGCRVPFGKLDDVAVRVFDESVDVLAAGTIGAGSADKFHALGFEFFAKLVTVRHVKRDVAGPARQRSLASILGRLDQFKRWPIILAAIAQIAHPFVSL